MKINILLLYKRIFDTYTVTFDFKNACFKHDEVSVSNHIKKI